MLALSQCNIAYSHLLVWTMNGYTSEILDIISATFETFGIVCINLFSSFCHLLLSKLFLKKTLERLELLVSRKLTNTRKILN